MVEEIQGKYDEIYQGSIHRDIANELAENNRLIRILIYCYLQTHLQIKKSPNELEQESLELLQDKTTKREDEDE